MLVARRQQIICFLLDSSWPQERQAGAAVSERSLAEARSATERVAAVEARLSQSLELWRFEADALTTALETQR